MLKITKFVKHLPDGYKRDSSKCAAITGYVYTIKKDGKVIKTQPISSGSITNSYKGFSTTAQGTYTVSVTVKTSLGDRTDGTNCVKTFTVPCACNVRRQSKASS
jgi:hypothetical protein